MGYDKENVADPKTYMMLIDLKVTNEIHSNQFAKSQSMPPN